MLKKVIAVAGPTASGKTALAIEIAKRFSGEIISCDSMQIYKGMDIGTAKPDMEEMQGIPHHMLDVVDMNTRYSVADFVSDARAAIDHVLIRGKLPVIAGGTGLYMDSVLNNIEFFEFECDPNFRKEMEKIAEAEGNEALHSRLLALDPQAAENIHPNNVRRVIRALEVCRFSGMTFTRANELSRQKPVYQPLIIGIDVERSLLYERINLRVDKMMERGLFDEVKNLCESGADRNSTAMQAIGYKEIADSLEGKCTREEAVEKIKMESRRYAKRQLTWFKRNENIHWINPEDGFDAVFELCGEFLKN